jgi:hypothetical protein
MNLQSRLNRLEKKVEPVSTGPITLFLRMSGPGLPVGEREVWGGRGREIVFDPVAGTPVLPDGPHKLIFGMDPDWV